MPSTSEAGVEWTVKQKLKLDHEVLDLEYDDKGGKLFVLAPGEVLVYSDGGTKLSSRIPVGKKYNRLDYKPASNVLVLASTRAGDVELLQLTNIHEFSLDGLPAKGPARAPVTIVVFSDYQ
jgi:hypothetical protein